jgi:hypothetical protein
VKLFLNLENLTNVRQTQWDPLLLPSARLSDDGLSMLGRRSTEGSSTAALDLHSK